MLSRVSILLMIGAVTAQQAEVKTSGGTVLGTQLPGGHGAVAVNQFLGLPFAAAKRWEPPVDFDQKYSKEPFNATMWGHACLQVLGPNSTYGSESCLVANVWQPAHTAPGANLPILVFIYGGSNQFGEAEPYNMSALAAYHNALCVNFNYRTGPIGWMAFPEDSESHKSTGNWGILDIQAALRWVQREAKALGGDPSAVAIHGQSSGGGLVELQYVAPQSKGLFSAAISESGGLGAAELSRALASTREAGASVGCKSSKGLKRCMQQQAGLSITNLTNYYSWGPVTDGVTFPKDPMSMLREGLVNPAHVILGAQTNDSFLFLSRDYTRGELPQPNNHKDGGLMKLSPAQYKKAVRESLGKVPAAVLEQVLQLYPPVGSHLSPSVQNVHSLASIESDQMHCSLRQRAHLLKKVTGAYVYRFNYWYQSNQQCSAVPNFHLPYLGAVHQDEVTFVMGQPNFMEDGSCCGKWGLSGGQEGCDRLQECTACYNTSYGEGYKAYFTEKEFNFARLVGEFWTNFAASGNPNSRSRNTLENAAPTRWPSIEQGGVVLDANLKSGHGVEKELYENPAVCKLWDSVV